MPAQAKLKVRKVEGELRNKPWMLYVPPYLSETGLRQKLYFASKQEAEQKATEFKVEKKRQTQAIHNLNEFDARQAQAMFRLLENSGLDIPALEVFKKGIESFTIQTKSRTFEDLVTEYVSKKSHLKPRYIQDIRSYSHRFPKIQDRHVCDLNQEDFSEVYKDFGDSSRNTFLNIFSPMFNYAIAKKYVAENPILKVDKVHIERKEVQTVPNAVVEGMLNDALENNLELLPYLVFGFFAGIRPEGEMSQVLWSDWNPARQILHIRAEICKTKKQRFIKVSDNAVTWLKAYQERGGSMEGNIAGFTKTVLGDRRDAMLKRMGTDFRWIQDGMRHTFCSNHIAVYNDFRETAALAGHRVEILERHYHNGIWQDDAARFWQIVPGAK